MNNKYCLFLAIYFDNVSTDNVEYTIRLRSETYTGSWNLGAITHRREALRTAPTYVKIALTSQHKHAAIFMF